MCDARRRGRSIGRRARADYTVARVFMDALSHIVTHRQHRAHSPFVLARRAHTRCSFGRRLFRSIPLVHRAWVELAGAGAFGGDTLLLERLGEHLRHLRCVPAGRDEKLIN